MAVSQAGLLVGGRDLQLETARFAFPALRLDVDDDCGLGGGGGGGSAAGAASPGTSGTAAGSGTSSVATAPTTSPPQRPPSKTKSNRALDRYPRTTPAPKSVSTATIS